MRWVATRAMRPSGGTSKALIQALVRTPVRHIDADKRRDERLRLD